MTNIDVFRFLQNRQQLSILSLNIIYFRLNLNLLFENHYSDLM